MEWPPFHSRGSSMAVPQYPNTYWPPNPYLWAASLPNRVQDIVTGVWPSLLKATSNAEASGLDGRKATTARWHASPGQCDLTPVAAVITLVIRFDERLRLSTPSSHSFGYRFVEPRRQKARACSSYHSACRSGVTVRAQWHIVQSACNGHQCVRRVPRVKAIVSPDSTRDAEGE